MQEKILTHMTRVRAPLAPDARKSPPSMPLDQRAATARPLRACRAAPALPTLVARRLAGFQELPLGATWGRVMRRHARGGMAACCVFVACLVAGCVA